MHDLNVLAVVKGKERYVFLYADAKRGDALRVMARYAANPDLSFSWRDAATLSRRMNTKHEVSDNPADPSC